MASHRGTRLKILINKYFVAVVLVLVVVTAGGAWATYTTTVSPGSHTEQRVASSWGVSGEFNYSAAVVNATPISDRGAIRSDRRFYFTNAMPVLDGRFDFQFEGAGGKATVTTRTTLVNYAVRTRTGIGGPSEIGGQSGTGSRSETRNRSDRRLWEITTPLGVERQRIEAGETANTTFSVDVSDIRERIRSIDRALGPISRTTDARTAVSVSVRLDGTVDGQRVQRSFNYTLPINSSAGYYVVYSPQKPKTTQFDITRRVIVPNDYGTLASLASFVGLLIPLIGLAGLFYGRENDWFDVSQTVRADVQRAKLRSEFEEWITSGAVAEGDDRTTVTVDSLEGLVDVAIDSDRRVVEDDESGAYIVLDDDVRYQFTPEWPAAADTETALEDRGSDGEFEPDAGTGDADTARVGLEQSDDGDISDENEQPTAVVELSGRTLDSDQENGTGNENATDDRPTDSQGVIDRLQSAVGSAIGRSSSAEGGSEAADGSDDEPALTDIRHVGEARAATLREAGFRTVADVRSATPAELREIGDIGATRAEQIQSSAAQVAEAAEDAESVPPTSAGEESDDQRNSRN